MRWGLTDMGDYYSRRNQPYAREVTREFWNAFKAYIDELVDQDWLFEQFGEEGYDFDREYRFIVSEKVKRKMLQELGCDLYPLPNNTPANEITFNLIEFFFKFISVQVKDGFDRGKTTYQYTIRINQLFENFKLSYKLEKGTVKPRHSGVMDRTITKDDFIIEDKETQTLINLAVEKFYDLKPSEQKIGLEKLVDAFQRVSSWEDNNKKRSVNSILDVLCKDQPALRTPLETELRSLWNTANEFMIRHTEMDKIKITDSDFLEYLFYRYYILLRFAFKKYGYVQNQSLSHQEDSVPDDEFIPDIDE